MRQILTSDREMQEGTRQEKSPLFLTPWDGLESEFLFTSL